MRVKGGMSLRNGMWRGLRNDIIMRNLIYGKWRKERNSTGKHARVSAALFLAPICASNRFAGPFITATKARLKPRNGRRGKIERKREDPGIEAVRKWQTR